MHDPHMLKSIRRLMPPPHRVRMHRPMRVRMHILLIFKIHDIRKLIARRALTRIHPVARAQKPVPRRIGAEFCDHGVKSVADFFEARAQQAEGVVGDCAEHDGAHGLVAGLFLHALRVREDYAGAVGEHVFHVRIGEDAG